VDGIFKKEFIKNLKESLEIKIGKMSKKFSPNNSNYKIIESQFDYILIVKSNAIIN
jgi:hypothetical protein